MENTKKNYLVWLLMVVIVILLGLVAYLGYNLYSKKDNTIVNTNDSVNSDKQGQMTTTTSTAKRTTKINIQVPKELESSIIEEFNDVANKAKYYLVTIKVDSDGDIYPATKHEIYDINFKKIATIPELKTSHIWNLDGTSILGNNVSSTAELLNNKIFSLARSTNNICDFVEYETYLENGKVKQNIIKSFADRTVSVSGEKC